MDMILLAVSFVAAILILWQLRNILGKRIGYDFSKDRQETAPEVKDVSLLPAPSKYFFGITELGAAPFARAGEKSVLNAEMAKKLSQIQEHTPNFHAEEFKYNAGKAYEEILIAYNKGDKEKLQHLLEPDILEDFLQEIARRQEAQQTIDYIFVGLKTIDFVDVYTEKESDFITLRFVAQMISTTYDVEGKCLSGNPQHIATVEDVWSFSHSPHEEDSFWKLAATEENESS